VVHARTLEVLEELGVTRELLARGLKVPIFRVRVRDRALITIDFSEIASLYPFTLMRPQDRIEQCLLARLEALGGRVVRGWEFVDFRASHSHVEARLRVGETVETIRRWLIGCDGMHGRVRERAGMEFAGAAYQRASCWGTSPWSGP
jgi:2-polyprenyl-6-methoxyphenol hydroxylase-like FAD-dependent oxidoreductase